MPEVQNRPVHTYCRQGPDELMPVGAGVLSGTRFVFKDLFDVAGYVTGAGTPEWLVTHPVAEQSSPLITALLEQGAHCAGRVQSDELAYSLNGQNIHYGTPVNPAAPDCLPGGSSSGSAVVVADFDADFSIGTDTGGSVRVPASYCGLYGLRPTLGSLSLEHCFELAKSFDTAGIFTRDLTLMHRVFESLSRKQVAGESARVLHLDQTLAMSLSEERLARLQAWCDSAGITLVQNNFIYEQNLTLAGLSELFRTIQGFEIIQRHGEWLTQHGESLDPAIGERVAWARSINEDLYQAALNRQNQFRESLLKQMQQGKGLWLVPTTPAGPPLLSFRSESLAAYRSELMGLTSIAGLTGLPQLHLPMLGLSEGPCGISLLGLPGSEGELIATGLELCTGEGS